MGEVLDRKRGFERVSILRWYADKLPESETEVEDIKIPVRETGGAVGYDIFSTQDITLEPSEEIKMPLGWKVYMMEDEVFKVHPRSGMGFKYYIRLANTTGIIDPDYYENEKNEGHCWIKLRNEGSEKIIIKKDDGIAQGIFSKVLLADGDSFGEGKKRRGGFGHTDNSG